MACSRDPVALGPGGGGGVRDDTVPTVLSTASCGACGGDCTLEQLEYDQSYHVGGPIDYADRPPAGGPHDPCWAPWGVHSEPVADDHWVHNLEHGGIVYLYCCTDCDDDVA